MWTHFWKKKKTYSFSKKKHTHFPKKHTHFPKKTYPFSETTYPFSRKTYPFSRKTYPFSKKHTHSPKNMPISKKTYSFTKENHMFWILTSSFKSVKLIWNSRSTSVRVWEESSDRGSEKFLALCEKWERLSRYIMIDDYHGNHSGNNPGPAC